MSQVAPTVDVVRAIQDCTVPRAEATGPQRMCCILDEKCQQARTVNRCWRCERAACVRCSVVTDYFDIRARLCHECATDYHGSDQHRQHHLAALAYDNDRQRRKLTRRTCPCA